MKAFTPLEIPKKPLKKVKFLTGFTLLEILVAILIFSFIIGGIYGVLTISKANYDTNLVSLNLQRQARQGMSRLIREVRQAYLASIVDKGVNRDSITFNTPNASGIKYSLVSGQLKRECPACTDIIIANDITALAFPAITGNLQKITLGASKTFRSLGQEQTLTFSLTDQVEVRNP